MYSWNTSGYSSIKNSKKANKFCLQLSSMSGWYIPSKVFENNVKLTSKTVYYMASNKNNFLRISLAKIHKLVSNKAVKIRVFMF